jgi:glycosyltransferase 2 family protein
MQRPLKSDLSLRQVTQTPFWKVFSFLFRLILGIGLVVISLWHVDLRTVSELLTHASIFWIFLALVSVLLSTGVKLLRWDWLLKQFSINANFQQTTGAFLVGQAGNIVLPVRAGEIIRIGWISAGNPGIAGEVLAAILIEKYLDLAALVVLLLTFGGEAFIIPLKWQFPTAVLATVFLIGVVWKGHALWQTISSWLRSRLPPVTFPWIDKADRLVDQVQWLKKPDRAICALGLTALTWLIMIVTNLLVLQSLSLPVDFKVGTLVLALVYVGVAPALMPGNFGPFYFFASLGVSLLAISNQQQIAFAVLLHALVTLPPLVLAGVYLLIRPLFQAKSHD